MCTDQGGVAHAAVAAACDGGSETGGAEFDDWVPDAAEEGGGGGGLELGGERERETYTHTHIERWRERGLCGRWVEGWRVI